MLTILIIILCFLLLQLTLFLLQGIVFAYRGFLKGNDHYKQRFYKKIVGIGLVLVLILLFNEFSKYVN